jgi:hypothetical protein
MPKQLAQCDAPGDREIADPEGWHELAVANPTFLLERLGSECNDVQGLRELTVNGLDAIAALDDRTGGRVVWDLDWERFDASAGRVRKLSVIDTGTGMTADQLRYHINQLAASGREQSSNGNFGVGAKVAAGSRNPHGLEYRSWHEGHGSLVCFKRHPDGRWGLEPQRWENGRTDFWRPLAEGDKPWPLRGRDHGTQVVLLGQHERHDTTQAPASVSEARRHWIARYLNARFLRLPTQVEVLVREQRERQEPGQLQHVSGEQHHLERRAVAAGDVPLNDAIARWWVLDDDQRARRREGTIWASTGHAAAVYDDELYDALPQTRGGYGRLQDFGIRFGYERVVLHLQPEVSAGRLQANTARTLLLLDHEPLPWARWGEEFAAAMPDEILQLQERAASADSAPRQEAIRDRVSAILPLYQLSRYRPARPTAPRPTRTGASGGGDTPAGAVQTKRGACNAAIAASSPTPSDTETAHDHSGSGPLTDCSDGGGRPEPMVGLPDVAWISARDGSRAASDLEDQAARYHPARHELTINADFRAITDLIGHWQRRYHGVPGARTVIEAHVREWCEQVLIEVVLAARHSTWREEQLDALLSPTSFTAALLPRHFLHATLKKRLAQKLGTPKNTISATTVRNSAAEEPGDHDAYEGES